MQQYHKSQQPRASSGLVESGQYLDPCPFGVTVVSTLQTVAVLQPGVVENLMGRTPAFVVVTTAPRKLGVRCIRPTFPESRA